MSMVEDNEPEDVEEDGGYGLFMAADWICCSLHVERQCTSRSWLFAERLESWTRDVSKDILATDHMNH